METIKESFWGFYHEAPLAIWILGCAWLMVFAFAIFAN